MFPFRPSRAATALFELAEAMLAPEPCERPFDDDPIATERVPTTASHQRRGVTPTERRRRPAPPHPDQACLTPLTRDGRAREREVREREAFRDASEALRP